MNNYYGSTVNLKVRKRVKLQTGVVTLIKERSFKVLKDMTDDVTSNKIPKKFSL